MTTVTNLRCYHSHPTITVGTGLLIGGNCGSPVEKNADVYVGLDRHSTRPHGNLPWKGVPAINIDYSIVDGGVPNDVADFKLMIDWLCNQLRDGKKVHVGCIGGHGRTGLVLAAILSNFEQGTTAAQWVRKNYCHKAIESEEQVKFLKKHFGLLEVPPSKPHYDSPVAATSWAKRYGVGQPLYDDDFAPESKPSRSAKMEPLPERAPKQKSLPLETKKRSSKKHTVDPVSKKKSMWGG